MAKTKEQKAEEKAIKLAEKTEVKQLESAQKAELTVLKTALKSEGLKTSEINKILSTEKKANSAELKTAKTTLNPTGRQTIATPGAPILSQASAAYANLPAAQQVASTLNSAVNAYNQYGLQQQQVIRGDGAYAGVALNDMAKLVLNRDANGNIVQSTDAGRVPSTLFNLANLSQQNLGKTFTADQIGNLKEVGTDAQGNKIFRDGLTSSPTRNSGAMYVQQADGSYKNVGYSMTTLPEQKESFFQSDLGKLALVGASLAGGWALAPAAFGGLGGAAAIGGSLGTSAAVGGAVGGAALGGTTAALSGGNVLTGAALGGVGGFAAGGGFTGFGDTLTNTFADITGLDANTVKSFLPGQGGGQFINQVFDDGSILVTDAAGQIVGGLDTAGQSFGNISAQVFDDGSRILTNAAGQVLGGTDTSGSFFNGQNAISTAGGSGVQTGAAGQYAGTGASLGGAANTSFGGGLGTLEQAAALTGAGAGAGLLSQLGDKATDAAKNLLGGGGGGGGNNGLGGLLGSLAGIGGTMLDRATLERYAAELQKSAAEQAPRMQFQPIGITTRFGSTTTPQYDEQGRLTGFGYTPAADIAAQRDRLLTLSNEALPTTTNIEQATANYLRGLESLQRPTDEQALADIQARLQATGRTGLGVGATSGIGGSNALAATNPELAAYYNAIAQRQSRQALEAEDVAQRRLTNQLTTSGNLFTQARDIETTAQQPLRLGSELGQMTTAGSTNAANAELRAAQLGAALKAEGAQGVNKALTLGGVGLAPSIGNILGSTFPSLGGLFGGGTQNQQQSYGGTTQATNDWLSGLNII
jgi:hypothetical protein